MNDKIQHIIAGVLVAAVTGLVGYLLAYQCAAAVWAAVTSAIIGGVIKEWYDYRSDFNNWDWWNFLATVIGAMLYGWESCNSTDTAVNGYCEETMRRYTDAVHPKTIGHKQWGYAFYCKIRAFLAGNL